MSNDYTQYLSNTVNGYKPSPVMKETEDDDIAGIHEAAQLLVALNEEKLAFQALAVPEPIKDLEVEKKQTERETAEIQSRLRGESLMLANQIRNTNVFEEIKKTEKRTKSIWHRIKVMIGWE